VRSYVRPVCAVIKTVVSTPETADHPLSAGAIAGAGERREVGAVHPVARPGSSISSIILLGSPPSRNLRLAADTDQTDATIALFARSAIGGGPLPEEPLGRIISVAVIVDAKPVSFSRRQREVRRAMSVCRLMIPSKGVWIGKPLFGAVTSMCRPICSSASSTHASAMQSRAKSGASIGARWPGAALARYMSH
jgi:hypothetical protein